MSKTRILIINDTHVGSVWGLWPPSYTAGHGKVLGANEIQKHLYQSWRDFTRKVSKRKIDAIIFLGDTIEGPGRYKRGRELMSPDLSDQVEAAVELFTPLLSKIQPSYIGVISGSDYHVSLQQDNERDLAKILGAEYLGLGPHDFEFGDVTVNFAHGTGGVYWYRGTKLDKIGFAMLLNIASEGLYNARYIVRAHYHFEAHLHYRHQDIYVAPCWQAQTDYMRRKDPLKLVPDIGALELTIQRNQLLHRFYRYPHPPRPKHHIEGFTVRPPSWPRFDVAALEGKP